MTDPNIVVLLGVIAACAFVSTLVLIGVGIAIDHHLTELRNDVQRLRQTDKFDGADDADDGGDADDDPPPPSVAHIYKREPTPAEAAYGQELAPKGFPELQGRGDTLSDTKWTDAAIDEWARKIAELPMPNREWLAAELMAQMRDDLQQRAMELDACAPKGLPSLIEQSELRHSAENALETTKDMLIAAIAQRDRCHNELALLRDTALEFVAEDHSPIIPPHRRVSVDIEVTEVRRGKLHGPTPEEEEALLKWSGCW